MDLLARLSGLQSGCIQPIGSSCVWLCGLSAVLLTCYQFCFRRHIMVRSRGESLCFLSMLMDLLARLSRLRFGCIQRWLHVSYLNIYSHF